MWAFWFRLFLGAAFLEFGSNDRRIRNDANRAATTPRWTCASSALAPEFVIEGRCLILGGKPGRGKPISPSPWRDEEGPGAVL